MTTLKQLEQINYKSVDGKFRNLHVKKFPEIIKSIYKDTAFLIESASLRERVYCIENNISEYSICLYCKKPITHFIDGSKGYPKYCSYSCSSKGTIDQTKQTNLEKYGVEYPSQEVTRKKRISKKIKAKPKIDKLHNQVLYKAKEQNMNDYGKEIISIDSVQKQNIVEQLSQYWSEEVGGYKVRSIVKDDALSLLVIRYTLFLPNNVTLSERIYCILNDLIEQPICQGKDCNNFVSYINIKRGYKKYCCTDCKSPYGRKKDKYDIIDIDDLRHLIRDQYWNGRQICFKELQKDYKLMYSINHYIKWVKKNTRFVDRINILLDGYNEYPKCSICGKDITNYHRGSHTFAKTCSEKCQNVIFKERNKANEDRYKEKSYQTKKKNNTFGSSKPEKEIKRLLKNEFGEIEYQYTSQEYPFACDFYIVDHNLYIEYQGTWTHNDRMFNSRSKKDIDHIKKWEDKQTLYYSNAIDIWTNKDPNKRQKALDNNLNWLEIFSYQNEQDILNQIHRVTDGLSIKYSEKDLKSEYQNILKKEGTFNTYSAHNKIILTFQPHFYEVENYIYKTNPIKRRKLIENRIKYLDKKEYELTDSDLLRGFKRSGIYYGFSHFSSLWIKAFIEQYNIKSIYDPCGGWGHRLLGCSKIPYIYNDLDERSCKGVNEIIEYFDMKDKVVHNNDASTFTPDEDYDCVFTCPPYHTTEEYTYIGSASDITDYNEFLIWWKQVIKSSIKKGVRYFAYVISHKFKEEMNNVLLELGYVFVEEIAIGVKKSGYLNGITDTNESLQIFKV